MGVPGDIVISVLIVRLVVDEVGLPKKLLFRVLELADHVGNSLSGLLMVCCSCWVEDCAVVEGYQRCGNNRTGVEAMDGSVS